MGRDGTEIMLRIGIIGSDSSHAVVFSKLANIRDEKTGEFLIPDTRVTAIFGLDSNRTREVANEGKIEFIAEKPEDLIGKVDAVMVVLRHGDLHIHYSLPFIKAGIPVWVDKPFTIKVEEAKQLIEEAYRNNTLLTGGSTCKYADEILELKYLVENPESIGGVVSGVLNFPADLNSEYGGLHFYGSHMAEMVMTIFGYNVRSVTTNICGDNVIATARYDRYDIVMNFFKQTPRHFGIVYGKTDVVIMELGLSSAYINGFRAFINMLRNGRNPFPLEQLSAPVVMLNAICESIKTGREVSLDEIDG